MNADRRKELDKLMPKVEEAKRFVEMKLNPILADWTELLGDLQEGIETCRDDEQEAFDNMPEGFQQGDRGQSAEAAIAAMETALEAFEAFERTEVADSELDDVITALDEAKAS